MSAQCDLDTLILMLLAAGTLVLLFTAWLWR